MADEQVSITVVLRDRFSRGFAVIGRQFRALGTQIQRLRAQLGPLTGQFGALVGTVASVQGINTAINLAEKQVQVEAKLLNTLGQRRDVQQEILRIAGQLQQRTVFGDEELAEVADLLLNMGVAVEDIDKALQATVNTSSALGVSLESSAKAIGLFQVGRAGELGERIGELGQLAQEGRLAADGIDLLNEKFAGAAEAVAATPFGQAQQRLNALGDQGEDLGKIFVDLKNDALAGFQDALAEIGRLAQSDQFRGLVDTLGQVLRFLGQISPIIIAIIGTFIAGAVAAKLVAIVSTLITITATLAGIVLSVGLIVAAIGGIIFAVTELTGTTDNLLGLLGDAVDDVEAIFGAIKDGTLTFSQLFDIIVTEVSNFLLQRFSDIQKVGVFLHRFVFDPVTNFLGGVISSVAGIFKFALAGIQQIGLKLIQVIVGALATVLREVLRVVDNIIRLLDQAITSARNGARSISDGIAGALAKAGAAVGLIDATAEQIEQANRRASPIQSTFSADLAGAIPEVDLFADKLKDLGEIQEANLKQITDSIPQGIAAARAAVEQGSAEIQEIDKQTNEAIALNNKTLQDRVTQQTIDRKKAETDAEFAAEKAKSEKILAETRRRLIEQAALERRLSELNAGTNIEQIKQDNAFRLQQLDFLLERQLVAETDFLAERERLLTLDIDKQIAAQDKLIKAQEDKIAGIREEQGANADVRLELQRLITLQLQGQQLANQEREVQFGLDQQRIALAEQITAKLEEQRQKVQDIVQENENLAEGGIITFAEAVDRNRQALNAFDTKVDISREKIRQLLAGEGFETDLASFQLRIDEASTNVAETGEANFASFFDAIKRGTQEATNDFNKLEVVGLQLGQTIGQSLGTEITNAFVAVQRGTKSFSEAFEEAGINILNSIASIITQMIVLRAISAATGVPVQALTVNRGGYIERNRGGGVEPVRRAEGGTIPGPNINRDMVPALLTPGEYVLRRGAVKHYGVPVLNAMNQKLVPKTSLAGFGVGGPVVPKQRFQTGGPVEPIDAETVQQDSQTAGMATIIANDENLERLLNGGENAMLRFLEDRKSQITGILGVTQG